MNDQQPNPMMNEQRFEDKMLETAWGEVETTFRSAGMIAPLPGFTSRWMERLELERQKDERKQAWALVLTNLVIAVGFILLIGIQYVPSVSSGGGIVPLWVEMVSRVVLFIRMAGGLVSTLLRTLPGLVPASWWVSGAAFMGLVVVLWVSMVRRHLSVQGVSHE
jgi:uncharacterized membrane protein YhdT